MNTNEIPKVIIELATQITNYNALLGITYIGELPKLDIEGDIQLRMRRDSIAQIIYNKVKEGKVSILPETK